MPHEKRVFTHLFYLYCVRWLLLLNRFTNKTLERQCFAPIILSQTGKRGCTTTMIYNLLFLWRDAGINNTLQLPKNIYSPRAPAKWVSYQSTCISWRTHKTHAEKYREAFVEKNTIIFIAAATHASAWVLGDERADRRSEINTKKKRKKHSLRTKNTRDANFFPI